jgi:AcrR family transcriptional regulator
VSVAPDAPDPAEVPYNLADSEWVRMPRQARSEETLTRFLDAAADLLAERPFAEISVNDIVERAGRTVGSFYARFDDKAGVLRVLVEQTAAQLRHDADEYWQVERWSDRTVGDIVSLAVDAVINAYREARPVFHAAALEAPNDEAFRHARRSVWVVCAERFGEVLADHAAELSHPDPARAGQVAMTALIATTDIRLIYGPGVRPLCDDDEQLASDLAGMVMSIVDPCPPVPRPIVPARPV